MFFQVSIIYGKISFETILKQGWYLDEPSKIESDYDVSKGKMHQKTDELSRHLQLLSEIYQKLRG